MNESWRPIPGWEGLYEVSDQGRVWTHKRRRLMSPSPTTSGHLHVTLSHHGERKFMAVHRAVLEAFVGASHEGEEACHADGDPTNNRLDNLRWDTRSSNMQDRTRHGNDWNAAKTHCPQNHPYSDTNTYSIPTGGRACRTCRNEASRRHRARKQEAA